MKREYKFDSELIPNISIFESSDGYVIDTENDSLHIIHKFIRKSMKYYSCCSVTKAVLMRALVYIKRYANLPRDFIDDIYKHINISRMFIEDGDEKDFMEMCVELSNPRDIVDELKKKYEVERNVVERFMLYALNKLPERRMFMIIRKVFKEECEERTKSIVIVINKCINEGNYEIALKFLQDETEDELNSMRARVVENIFRLNPKTLKPGSAEDILIQVAAINFNGMTYTSKNLCKDIHQE